MNKEFTIKITKEGLKTIMAALECYSRLGVNQFAYCLEHNPAFDKLDWGEKREVEEYLRFKIDNRGFGIYHPDVAPFTKAFEIKKEIQKYVTIAEKPIMEHIENSYDGAPKDEPYLPHFIDEKGERVRHEIRIKIPKKNQSEAKILIAKGKFDELWGYINKNINFNGVTGNSTRISDDGTEIIISSPYRIDKKGKKD